MEAVILLHILFCCELSCTIGAERLKRMLFIRGGADLRAIDRRTTRQNKALKRTASPSSLQHRHSSANVDARIFGRFFNRDAKIDLGSKMEELFGLKFPHGNGCFRRSYTTLEKRCHLGHLAAQSRAQIIDHLHLTAFIDQALHEMRTNEPGSAGDRHPHEFAP